MSEPTSQTITRNDHDGVAVLTIDDPSTRNALSAPTLTALTEQLAAVDEDEQIHASVITGAGKVFAAGANLRELRETSPTDYLTGPRRAAWERLGGIDKPVVAAVGGVAFGGGCELALACDLIVAGDDARFGQPEVGLGLIPGAGGTQRWARGIGRYAATRLVLSGQPIDVWQAHELGVVAEVVPREALVASAVELARSVSAGAPLAVRFAKRALRLSEDLPISRALEHERTLLAALLATDDLQEGVAAFLDRRRPQFQGR